MQKLNSDSLFLISDRWPAGSAEWFLQILLRFTLSTVGIIARVRRLLILGHGALALSANVEDLTQIHVRPDLDPLRFQVAIERIAEYVRCRLKIA